MGPIETSGIVISTTKLQGVKEYRLPGPFYFINQKAFDKFVYHVKESFYALGYTTVIVNTQEQFNEYKLVEIIDTEEKTPVEDTPIPPPIEEYEDWSALEFDPDTDLFLLDTF